MVFFSPLWETSGVSVFLSLVRVFVVGVTKNIGLDLWVGSVFDCCLLVGWVDLFLRGESVLASCEVQRVVGRVSSPDLQWVVWFGAEELQGWLRLTFYGAGGELISLTKPVIFGGLCGTFYLGFSNFQMKSNCIHIVIAIKKAMEVQTNIDSENKCFRESHSSASRYFTHFPTLLFYVVFVFGKQN